MSQTNITNVEFKNPTISENLLRFQSDGHLVDVTIQQNQRRFRGHKIILSSAFTYFIKEFREFPERTQYDVKEDEVHPEIFDALFMYSYTSKIDINSGNARHIAVAANHLVDQRLLQEAEKFLHDTVTHENMFEMAEFARHNRLTELSKFCSGLIYQHVKSKVSSAEEWQKLFDNLDVEHLSYQQREELFISLIRWFKEDLYNRQSYCKKFFSYIPFSSFTDEFAEKNIRPEELISWNFQLVVKLGPIFSPLVHKSRDLLFAIAGQTWNHSKSENDDEPSSSLYSLAYQKWFQFKTDARSHFGAAVHLGKVYIAGGIKGEEHIMDSLDVFDIQTGEWEFLHRMAHPRKDCAMAVLNGKLYIAGGETYKGAVEPYVERFDLATKQWQTCAQLKKPRTCIELVELGGKLYAIGGKNGPDKRRVEQYDERKNQWTKKANCPKPMANFGAVVFDNKIFISNGKSFQSYDPRDNKWVKLTSPKMDEKDQFRMVAYDGQIYLVGETADKGKKNLIKVYDFPTKDWKDPPAALAALDVSRANYRLVVISDYVM